MVFTQKKSFRSYHECARTVEWGVAVDMISDHSLCEVTNLSEVPLELSEDFSVWVRRPARLSERLL